MSRVTSEYINHNTTYIIEQLLSQGSTISNSKLIKRNNLERSTREDIQFLDLVNKYDSLIIYFKKSKS